jgi:soluble lytic murein transglycosylase-like protein
MSVFKSTAKLTSLSLLTISGAFAIMYFMRPEPQAIPVVHEVHTAEFQKAFFEAAKVYGKAGCGDQALAEMTAKHAISTGLPAQLIAAQVATESMCNPQAVSNKGAIGLTQVVPKQWSREFDFSKINLFNPDDNMTVGTSILGKLVKEHGLKNGLLRYYGTGSDGIGLGGSGYADKILLLTGKL